MKLKRHYLTPEGWEPRRNLRLGDGSLMVPSMGEGDCLNPPPLDYVDLHHTGASAEQNFSEDLVAAALREGWASFDGGDLVLDVRPEPLRYAVSRTPGRYCCHCDVRLPDADSDGHKARDHVATEHAGVDSPDTNNPAGYLRLHHYETTLNSAQHEKFNIDTYAARRAGGE